VIQSTQEFQDTTWLDTESLDYASALEQYWAGLSRGVQTPDGSLSYSDSELVMVGEGFRWEDRQIVPALKIVEHEYTDVNSITQTAQRQELQLVSLEYSDLSDPVVIPASLPPLTVSGKFNAADTLAGRTDLPLSSPRWGWISGGGEFVGVHREGDLVLPKIHGSPEIYAIDLTTGERAWTVSGWADYPTEVADFNGQLGTFASPEAGTAREIGADSSRTDLDYSSRNYTVLGPGSSGNFLVHVTETFWYPEIRFDLDTRKVYDSIPRFPGLDTVSHSANPKAWWKSTTYGFPELITDPTETNPAFFQGISEGPLGILGYPNHLRVCSVYSLLESETLVDEFFENLIMDLEESLLDTQFKGMIPYRVISRIEQRSILTGELVNTLEKTADEAILPGKNVKGVGTYLVLEGTGGDVELWPSHPQHPTNGNPLWIQDPPAWIPFPPEKPIYYPPDAGGPGTIGGRWEDRGLAPSFLHFTFTGVLGAQTWADFCEIGHPSAVVERYQTGNDFWTIYSQESGTRSSSGFVPAGIFVDYGESTPTADYHLVHTYLPYAPGEQEFNKRQLPFPFDCRNYCTDGEIVVFFPTKYAPLAMTNTLQGLAVNPIAPDQTLPDRQAEAERIHKICAFNLSDWTEAWTLDARTEFGGSLTLASGEQHPSLGDLVGVPAIRDGVVFAQFRGSAGIWQAAIDLATGSVLESRLVSSISNLVATSGLYDWTGSVSIPGSLISQHRDDSILTGGRIYLVGLSGAHRLR